MFGVGGGNRDLGEEVFPAGAEPKPPTAQLLNQPAAPRPGQGLRLGKIAGVVQPGRGIAQTTQAPKGAEGEGGAGAFPGRGITQTIRGLMRDTFAESSGGLEPVLQAQTGKIGKVGRVAGH